MRILIVAPAFGRGDLGSYVGRIFKTMRVKTATFAYAVGKRGDLQRELLAACRALEPSVLFGLKLDRIAPETLRAVRGSGARVLLWYVDCLARKPPAWLRSRVRESDAVFVSAKGLLPAYRAMASPTPVHWMMEGAYLPAFPSLDVSAEERTLFGSEVAFVGSIYHPMPEPGHFHGRARLLRAIGARYDLKIWGPQRYPGTRARLGRRLALIQWPAYNDDLVRICRSSRIVVGMNSINSIELYFSNRTFLTLAAGGFHLTHYVPGLETLFRNHEHLVWFHSTDECLELIAHYLARPARAAAIANQGRTFVRRRFGMARQVKRMLQIMSAHHG